MRDTIDRWMKSAGSVIQLSVMAWLVLSSALLSMLEWWSTWWPHYATSVVVGSALFYWCYLVGDTDGDN